MYIVFDEEKHCGVDFAAPFREHVRSRAHCVEIHGERNIVYVVKIDGQEVLEDIYYHLISNKTVVISARVRIANVFIGCITCSIYIRRSIYTTIKRSDGVLSVMFFGYRPRQRWASPPRDVGTHDSTFLPPIRKQKCRGTCLNGNPCPRVKNLVNGLCPKCRKNHS